MPKKEWLNNLSEEAKGYLEEGVEKHENNQLEEALDDFEKAISIETENDATEDDNVDKPRKDEEDDEDTSIEPRLFWVWLSKGKVHLDKGQYSKAVECYDKALSIEPRYIIALINKANALRKQGRYLEATRLLGKVECQEPENQVAAALIWASEGMMDRRDGKLRDAEKCLSKALEIFSELSGVKPVLSDIREELSGE